MCGAPFDRPYVRNIHFSASDEVEIVSRLLCHQSQGEVYPNGEPEQTIRQRDEMSPKLWDLERESNGLEHLQD